MAELENKTPGSCDSNCSTCGSNCPSRNGGTPDFKAKLADGCSVKKVIGIVSGKGGVGKSTVTSLLASGVNKAGYKTAIIDADITGPSIPKAFGLSNDGVGVTEDGKLMIPDRSANGIRIISSNLLLENETDPIIWRGSLIAQAVKQFWSEVNWKDIDFMFVDMPPGTGDVPLTVFQSLPVDGIIIVTSPQELVSMIVKKAVNMATKMNVPIIGIIENMSYLKCPHCGETIQVFGESHIDEVAAENNLKVLAKLPMDPKNSAYMDAGAVEAIDLPEIKDAVKAVEEL
ncbi:MAG: Mrp/NBP35 family ATP-binding protein [Lachnospiraceae bacterium]|nr:Mrp/NBP35 family ATP-binding protein [Lachnospiraceae bacterium]